jgi:isopentenyl phosphate kinase
MDIVIVKLGGSLITDKSRRARTRSAIILRLATEIARASARIRARIIVGHGSGSFGHHAATEHSLLETTSPRRQAPGTAAVQRAAHTLHRRVTDAMESAGVMPFSVLPSSTCSGRDGRVTRMDARPFASALEADLVPITCGDVVLDASGRATICSTEAVLLALTRKLIRAGHRIRRAVWLGITDGVYDADGRTISTLDAARIPAVARGAQTTDVTGGMRLRVGTTLKFARLGVESWVLDGRAAGVLEAALGGRRTGGTRVPPKRRAR